MERKTATPNPDQQWEGGRTPGPPNSNRQWGEGRWPGQTNGPLNNSPARGDFTRTLRWGPKREEQTIQPEEAERMSWDNEGLPDYWERSHRPPAIGHTRWQNRDVMGQGREQQSHTEGRGRTREAARSREERMYQTREREREEGSHERRVGRWLTETGEPLPRRGPPPDRRGEADAPTRQQGEGPGAGPGYRGPGDGGLRSPQQARAGREARRRWEWSREEEITQQRPGGAPTRDQGDRRNATGRGAGPLNPRRGGGRGRWENMRKDRQMETEGRVWDGNEQEFAERDQPLEQEPRFASTRIDGEQQRNLTGRREEERRPRRRSRDAFHRRRRRASTESSDSSPSPSPAFRTTQRQTRDTHTESQRRIAAIKPKIPTFSGGTCQQYVEFITKFQLAARQQEWDETEKLEQLLQHLSGNAFRLVEVKYKAGDLTTDRAIQALSRRYKKQVQRDTPGTPGRPDGRAETVSPHRGQRDQTTDRFINKQWGEYYPGGSGERRGADSHTKKRRGPRRNGSSGRSGGGRTRRGGGGKDGEDGGDGEDCGRRGRGN